MNYHGYGVEIVGFENETMIKIVTLERIDIFLDVRGLNVMGLLYDHRIKQCRQGARLSVLPLGTRDVRRCGWWQARDQKKLDTPGFNRVYISNIPFVNSLLDLNPFPNLWHDLRIMHLQKR